MPTSLPSLIISGDLKPLSPETLRFAGLLINEQTLFSLFLVPLRRVGPQTLLFRSFLISQGLVLQAGHMFLWAQQPS